MSEFSEAWDRAKRTQREFEFDMGLIDVVAARLPVPERQQALEGAIQRLHHIQSEGLYEGQGLAIFVRLCQLDRQVELLRQIQVARRPSTKGAASQRVQCEERRSRVREHFLKLRNQDPSYSKGRFEKHHARDYGLKRSTILQYLSDL